MRYGYHLVTDCLKANQGKKSHKDVEPTIIHHFNTNTDISATKAKPFPDGKQADILLSGITSIDNPTARNLHLDVTSTNPMGVTNQELINRADLGHQPGPGEHDPRNDVLTSAKCAEERKHTKYDAICAATGSVEYVGPAFGYGSARRRAGLGGARGVGQLRTPSWRMSEAAFQLISTSTILCVSCEKVTNMVALNS